jgi:hypothetical protein
MASRSRGAIASGSCAATPKTRVQGMPGARCTRGLACKFVQTNAHEHTGSAEAIRHSLRNGSTAYAVLSPATNSSCHRRLRIKTCPSPVGPTRLLSTGLTSATDARTTRFCRTLQRRRLHAANRSRAFRQPALPSRVTPNAAASTASHPAFVTIAIRPSCRVRRANL